MKNALRVLDLLKAVSIQNVDRTGLNQLIELTQSFAGTYLKYRYKNLSRSLLAEDVSHYEMAVDAIAPLFERDKEGRLTRINKAFLSWNPAIETEEQALFFLNSLAARSTEKYISELLRESDPFFSKILRSVKYMIDSRGYRKKQILGTTYIISAAEVKISGLPSNQFIYDLPAYLFNGNSDIIREVFSYIKLNTDKTEAIPLNALVVKIKKTGLQEFEQNGNPEIEKTFEIKLLVNKAISAAYTKLTASYIMKNKIDETESDAIKKALQKIVTDMQDGGINTGLHKYLIEEMPYISFDDYRKKYQNMFEYLYKVLKREIIRQIED